MCYFTFPRLESNHCMLSVCSFSFSPFSLCSFIILECVCVCVCMCVCVCVCVCGFAADLTGLWTVGMLGALLNSSLVFSHWLRLSKQRRRHWWKSRGRHSSHSFSPVRPCAVAVCPSPFLLSSLLTQSHFPINKPTTFRSSPLSSTDEWEWNRTGMTRGIPWCVNYETQPGLDLWPNLGIGITVLWSYCGSLVPAQIRY